MEASERTPARAWAWLALLTAIYALNFADRQLLAVVLDPVKAELGASDAQMGWLTGTAFALFYTLASIPIARLADRADRLSIASAGLAVWSAMTAACGLARTFAQLVAARIGVGVGEAACTPPAHSMIASLFGPKRRATAIAIYSTGIYLGMYVAYDLGGAMYERWGWRTPFFVFGIVGLLVAQIGWLRAPELAHAPAEAHLDTRAALRTILGSRTFRHLAAGAAIKSIGGYALTQWVVAFLGRLHGFEPAEAGDALAPIVGFGGAFGTFAGGWLADRLARRDERWRMRSAALAILASLPFLYWFLFAQQASTALWAYVPATVLGAMYLGPVFALAQSLFAPELRATASAVLLFAINLIGLGLGPWLTGLFSDALGGKEEPSALRWALAIVCATYAWGAAHLLRASRPR